MMSFTVVGAVISRFFACSNEEKNKPKQQRVHALVLSLCIKPVKFFDLSSPQNQQVTKKPNLK